MAKGAAKGAARRLHAALSRNRWLSARYIELAGLLCRAAPDAAWKGHVRNALQEAPWPQLHLPARRTRLPGLEKAIQLVPHLGEFDFAANIYRTLPYESEVFDWLATRRYTAVIDIGANVGLYSLYFAKRFPEAQVYAFEPSRRAYARLVINVEANGCRNVLTYNCGIHESSGFVIFHEPEGHLTNGSLDASFAAMFSDTVISTPVAMMAGAALETFFERAPLMLKIDAEGAEPAIVAALDGLIRRYRPDLLIEVLPDTAERLNALPLFRDSGYRLLHLVPGGPIERDRFVASDHRDYALVHPG